MSNMERGHREYRVICSLHHMPTENYGGSGVGSCSTMETRYRYRWQGGQRVEFDNPADYYNTALKMAKKRAHVDAILTATAASDCFTQDVEDTQREKQRPARRPAPQRREEPEQPAAEPVQAGNGDTLITRPQVIRLKTIAGTNGWSVEDGKALLSRFGYTTSTDIQVRHYKAVIACIEEGREPTDEEIA